MHHVAESRKGGCSEVGPIGPSLRRRRWLSPDNVQPSSAQLSARVAHRLASLCAKSRAQTTGVQTRNHAGRRYELGGSRRSQFGRDGGDQDGS